MGWTFGQCPELVSLGLGEPNSQNQCHSPALGLRSQLQHWIMLTAILSVCSMNKTMSVRMSHVQMGLNMCCDHGKLRIPEEGSTEMSTSPDLPKRRLLILPKLVTWGDRSSHLD